MHCEKCGSADTEIIKCSKCSQKSRVHCKNCKYSDCTDKYCEVISIKSKIRLLSTIAGVLAVLLLVLGPTILMKGWDEDPTPVPVPTKVASKPPRPTRAPPPPPPTEEEPVQEDPALVLARRRDQLVEISKQLSVQKIGYAKGGDVSAGATDFTGLVVHIYKQMGIDLPRNPGKILKMGKRIEDFDALVKGDILVFTKDPKKPRPALLGVYMGSEQFVTVLPRRGVIQSSTKHKNWAPRLIQALRVLK